MRDTLSFLIFSHLLKSPGQEDVLNNFSEFFTFKIHSLSVIVVLDHLIRSSVKHGRNFVPLSTIKSDSQKYYPFFLRSPRLPIDIRIELINPSLFDSFNFLTQTFGNYGPIMSIEFYQLCKFIILSKRPHIVSTSVNYFTTVQILRHFCYSFLYY